MHALRASDHAICGLTMSDRDFCMRFRRFIFRLISDKFRQSMGNSRWPCPGLSLIVIVCHGVFRQCPRFKYSFLSSVTVRHGLSRFVTQHVRQFEANMNIFPITCNLRLLHFDNACAICDHQKWLHYLHAFPIWPYSRAWILKEHSEPPGMARVVKISCRNGSLTIHRLELLVIMSMLS